MKALVFERRELRYAASVVLERTVPGTGLAIGPLQLRDVDPPRPPGPDWSEVAVRIAGICGSDLATVSGTTSRYFEPLVSFPFIPGHEVVGDTGGRRVVLDAVLGHAARGATPPSPGAAPADGHDYSHLVTGPLEPGIQTGTCAEVGGGFAERLVAHASQLHDVPADLDDTDAVLIEPVAGAVHAALRARPADGDTAVVLGAGTMGLATVAALRALTGVGRIVAVAKHAVQRRWALELGADVVVGPDEVRRGVRRIVGGGVTGDVLGRGADVVIDAVGSGASVTDAVAVTRPRGRVVLLGMPGVVRMDLAPVWHREIELVGAYTYGTEELADGRRCHTFELATVLVRDLRLGRLVSAVYPLRRWREAFTHAAEAGRRGAVKICLSP